MTNHDKTLAQQIMNRKNDAKSNAAWFMGQII
jgi:hypothetical protein